jgi:chromosome segregation ATPase
VNVYLLILCSYEKGYKLTGVIYLHRITDIRMSGMSRRTFKILRELCGQETLSNVLIVTNMWSDPPTAKQLQTEKQLQESSKFFEPAIKAGARMVRRPRKDADSAHDIIRLLLDKAPVAMKIQRQIVDDGEGFYSTDAVRVLGEELAEAEQRHQQEIEEVKKELRKAKEQNDVQTQIELREYLEQATAESARLFKEIQALREGFDEERLRWEKRVDAAEEARLDAERKQTELVEQLEQLRLQAEEARGRERSILENAMAEVLSKMAELKRNQQSWGCVIM